MQDLEQFKKDRKLALLSLDEQKIRAMYKKYNDDRDMPANAELFWRSVHKAITGCLDLPIEFRHKSKLWLNERGYKSLDDGDLHTSACCKELATVAGEGRGRGSTHWHQCSKCGKACDLLLL